MPDGDTGPVGRAVERVSGVVDLVTTLDQRLEAALDSLEEMRRTIAGLDDVRRAILRKIDEVDLEGFGKRLERLEAAVFNIEKATINLDRAFEGSVEALPDFMTRKIKGEGVRKAPPPASEQPLT